MFSPSSYAKIYYVDSSNTRFFTNGSIENPETSINSGIDLLSSDGGDTLIIKPGTYKEDITSVKNGSETAYNIIKAEKDGSVIITGILSLPSRSAYVQFEGLKWDNQQTKSITGHHLKFMRCAFKGGPATDNTMSVSIGTNDVTPGAQHILIEDSWSYGMGGRYNFLIFNADSVVLRRVIARHDGGWTGSGFDPEAGITIYNSSNVEIQNSMVIDSNEKYQYWESAFYNVKNDSSPVPYMNTRIVGSIVLNAPYGNSFAYDDYGAMKNARLENNLAWNSGGGLALNGDNKQIIATNLTIGALLGTGIAIWAGNKNTLDLSNSLFYFSDKRHIRINAGRANIYNNNCFPRDSSDCGQHSTYHNPANNGLKHLPGTTTGSKLNDKNRRIGAYILHRTGVDGTLYGEQGFNVTTAKPLWPWPNEQRIKNDLCENTKRGLCTNDQSLTHYIWNYLGNAVHKSCGYTKTYEQCLSN